MSGLGTWIHRLFNPDTTDDDVRRAAQLEAVDGLVHLPVHEETIPTYALEATASRQTTPDTHDDTDSERPNGHPTTHKENPMTALHNRALALKLAVESAASPEDGAYSIVESNGTIDESYLTGVLALADRFVTYLGADEPSTSVPSGDSPVDRPADDTETTIEAIRSLLQRSRGDLGDRATTAALGQIDQLRSATRGQGRDAVIRTAIEFVDSTGRSEFGGVVATRLIASLRAL